MPIVCGHVVDNLASFGENSRDEQPEGLVEESLFRERDGDYPLSDPFWDSCFSDPSWGVPQPNARNGMGIGSLLPEPTRQPTPTTALSRGDGVGVEGATAVAAMTASRPKPSNRFQCPDCGKILSRHDSLKRHQQTQHNREVEEHLCPHQLCKRSRPGSGFSRPDGLRRHLKACKLRLTRAATLTVESVDIQPDSGIETREDSQPLSSRRDTRSMENRDDANNQQLSPDSLIAGLRKCLAEEEAASDRAKHEYEESQAACDRAKHKYEERQRNIANYRTTIEMLEKGRTG